MKSVIAGSATDSHSSSSENAHLARSAELVARFRLLFLCSLVVLTLVACDSGGGGGGKKSNLNEAPAPDAPLVRADISGQQVALNWDPVDDADYYQVFRHDSTNDASADQITTDEWVQTRYDETVDAGRWYYWVKACNEEDDKCSDFSGIRQVFAVAEVLPAPFGFKGRVDGIRVALQWDQTADAAYYQIYRSRANEAPDTPAVNQWTETSYDQTVDAGVWYYWVKACSEQANCSDFSQRVSVTVASQAEFPAAPVIENVDSSGQSVTLEWTSIEDAASYQVYRFDNTSDRFDGVLREGPSADTSTSINIDPEAVGIWYYRVIACYQNGKCSDFSGVSNRVTVALAVPRNVEARANGTSIDLSWDGVDGVTSYRIFRYPGDSGLLNDVFTSQAEDGTSYRDSPGVGTWKYQIKACIDRFCSGHSRFSNPAAVAPAEPEGFGASVNGTSVDLSWDSVARAIISYTIYRSDMSNDVTQDKYIGTTRSNTDQTYDVPGVGSWYYWIKACASYDNCSDYSQVSNQVTVPPAVPVLQVRVTGTTVDLSWDSVTDATSYKIYRSNMSNDVAEDKHIKTTSNDETSDTPGAGVWYYWLRACATGNNCSGYSQVSSPMTVPPDEPELRARVTGTIVDLSWDSVAGATSYKLYRNPSGADVTKDNFIGSTSQENTSDTPGVGTWYYWIKACAGEDNCSGYSNPPLQKGVAPAVPESLSVSAIGTIVDVSWDNSVDGAAYYAIYRSDMSDDASPDLRSEPLASQTSYDETVDAGIWYYSIKACLANGVACSDFSSTVRTAFLSNLNDTGVTWGGSYQSGNNPTCTGLGGSTPLAEQDCHQGRDFDYSDDSDGHAGFSFTRLDASGADYTGDLTPDSSGTYPWKCVRDKVTGLIWEVKTDDDTTHDKDNTYVWGTGNDGWSDLVDSANNSQLCGLSDWRVPTRNELFSITNPHRKFPAIDTSYFPNTSNGDYWSSSSVHDSNDNAWHPSFANSDISSSSKTGSKRVRLVYGGRLQDQQTNSSYDDWADNRYIVHSNGTVTDIRTGLMWKRCVQGRSGNACTGNASSMNWKAALADAANSSFAEYSDWRLPNIKELVSLAAETQSSPAINGTVFPNTPSDRFWTSTPSVSDITASWVINFDSGDQEAPLRRQNRRVHVRLVRAGQ